MTQPDLCRRLWRTSAGQCVSEAIEYRPVGSNHYPGLSFGNFFNDWKALSPKPLLRGNGADAYDGTKGQVDEQTQADIVAGLTEEIHANGQSMAAVSAQAASSLSLTTNGGKGWR